MQLTLHNEPGLNLIRSCEVNRVSIDSRQFEASLLVLPDAIHPDWPVKSVDQLAPDQIDRLLSFQTDLVLLGTGARQQFPSAAVLAQFQRQGMGCEVMDTLAACRTYNVLVSEGRRILAALILE